MLRRLTRRRRPGRRSPRRSTAARRRDVRSRCLRAGDPSPDLPDLAEPRRDRRLHPPPRGHHHRRGARRPGSSSSSPARSATRRQRPAGPRRCSSPTTALATRSPPWSGSSSAIQRSPLRPSSRPRLRPRRRPRRSRSALARPGAPPLPPERARLRVGPPRGGRRLGEPARRLARGRCSVRPRARRERRPIRHSRGADARHLSTRVRIARSVLADWRQRALDTGSRVRLVIGADTAAPLRRDRDRRLHGSRRLDVEETLGLR